MQGLLLCSDHTVLPVGCVQTFLPSSLTHKDMGELVSQVLLDHQGAFVCADTIVASQKLVSDSACAFTELIRLKAENVSE